MPLLLGGGLRKSAYVAYPSGPVPSSDDVTSWSPLAPVIPPPSMRWMMSRPAPAPESATIDTALVVLQLLAALGSPIAWACARAAWPRTMWVAAAGIATHR